MSDLGDKKLREIIEKPWKDYFGSLEIKPNQKPSHGSCCTCQTCGYDYDNCNCTIREIIKFIDETFTTIKQKFEIVYKMETENNAKI